MGEGVREGEEARYAQSVVYLLVKVLAVKLHVLGQPAGEAEQVNARVGARKVIAAVDLHVGLLNDANLRTVVVAVCKEKEGRKEGSECEVCARSGLARKQPVGAPIVRSWCWKRSKWGARTCPQATSHPQSPCCRPNHEQWNCRERSRLL